MALRLVELTLPSDLAAPARELLRGHVDEGLRRREQLHDGQVILRVLVDSDHTGALVDECETRFGQTNGFEVLIMAVEAALPRPVDSEHDEASDPPPRRIGGVSREELYALVGDMAAIDGIFLAMTALSTVVAAVGLLRENVAVIIGAMVIAPLLGPNVALALAATLGDGRLLRRALTLNLVGVSVALGLTVLLGMIVGADPANQEIMTRTEVMLSDIVLALAAGAAGALALTKGVPAALVGVMVAVALLPPTVVFGLTLGAGQFANAGGAALLLLTNVICINLSGILTFVIRGVRPLGWSEAEGARRARRTALIVWGVLLLLVSVMIIVLLREA